jgi:phage/plasmid-associated DNA primase
VLYAEYKRWAEEAGEKYVMNSTVFGTKLSSRDTITGEHSRRGKVYRGIGLPFPDKNDNDCDGL